MDQVMIDQTRKKSRATLLLPALLLVGACHPAISGPITTARRPGASRPATTAAIDKTGQTQTVIGSGIGIRPSYTECLNHQPEEASPAGHMEGCASEEWEYQRERLDKTLASIKEAFESNQGTARHKDLIDSQKAWDSRLNETCADEAARGTSTMAPANFSICLMQRTAERVEELRRAYQADR